MEAPGEMRLWQRDTPAPVQLLALIDARWVQKHRDGRQGDSLMPAAPVQEIASMARGAKQAYKLAVASGARRSGIQNTTYG